MMDLYVKKLREELRAQSAKFDEAMNLLDRSFFLMTSVKSFKSKCTSSPSMIGPQSSFTLTNDIHSFRKMVK